MTPSLANHILQRVGETGQPPELGIEHLNVGNETVLEVLRSQYLEPMAKLARGSSFKVVQGYYGGGKTHFLTCVRDRAWQLRMCTALVGLSPAECAFDDPQRVYAAVARELTWAPIDPNVAPDRGIEHALRAAVEERRAELGETALKAWIDTTLRHLPVDSPSYRAAVVAFCRATLKGDDDTADLVGAWLRGEAISLTELQPFSVRESHDRANGFRMLRSLCQVLRGLGAPGLYLAFDELDRTLSLSPKRRRGIADHLRELIDLCGKEQLPGVLVLYAAPPEFLRNIVPEYPALQGRLRAPAVLSERSPQAVLIDLEQLDLTNDKLLYQIGLRLLSLFLAGPGPDLDEALQQTNLRTLVQHVLGSQLDVAHRRTFVKAAVDLLYQQRVEPGLLSSGDVARIAGQAAQLAETSGAYEEF